MAKKKMKGKQKYIVVCKYCGRILLKTEDTIVKVLVIEIKCPQCKKILRIDRDTIITLDKPS